MPEPVMRTIEMLTAPATVTALAALIGAGIPYWFNNYFSKKQSKNDKFEILYREISEWYNSRITVFEMLAAGIQNNENKLSESISAQRGFGTMFVKNESFIYLYFSDISNDYEKVREKTEHLNAKIIAVCTHINSYNNEEKKSFAKEWEESIGVIKNDYKCLHTKLIKIAKKLYGKK